ncbi:MAG: ATP-binding protein, partial [Candidatus Syntrophosphaera sp.]
RLSHNVRRHITNVLLALKPLEENGQGSNGPEYREYAQIIRKEIEKIRVFTHAFQRFSELKEYDLKMQDVIPSVDHCVNHARIPSNVKLIRNWPDRSIEALSEPLRFEEALSNILNNALEAMPDGGTLQVSVKSFPGHTSPGGRLSVLIEVEDSGRGIPKDQMDEVWQLYYTTKESGTGIGLPEARKIIESMGGNIDIQSEPGMGTVVSLWLKGESDG